jgi:DNA mismatch repair protein MutS
MQMDFSSIEKDALIERLSKADVLNMTPMDAMNALYAFIKEAKDIM